MRLMCSIFLFLLSSSLPALALVNSGPQVSEYQLDNGLKLVVIPDRRAPVVTHMIWYMVGSADDPSGKSGIAHFLEHMMFKGTSNTPPDEFSSAVTSIGGQENAFTSYDYTAYYQKVSPTALPDMMKYEADRMRNIVLTEEAVSTEREVILEERNGRVDASPRAILSEFTQASLHVHHPYGIPVIGWEHEINDLEKKDLLSFYDRWYQPWNAIVVVAGDVEPEEVLKIANHTYGKIEEDRAPEKRQRVLDPAPVVSKQLVYSDKRVANPVWRRSFIAPSYFTAGEREAEALDLLAAILGESASSRIYTELVLNQEIATGAGAYYQGSQRDSGTFGFYATPRGDATLEELEHAMETQVDKLLNEGVSQDELDRARKSYLKSLIYSQDSQVSLARIFGSILATGGSVDDFKRWPERLTSVTVDDVNNSARKYLIRDQSVTSRLLPEVE